MSFKFSITCYNIPPNDPDIENKKTLYWFVIEHDDTEIKVHMTLDKDDELSSKTYPRWVRTFDMEALIHFRDDLTKLIDATEIGAKIARDTFNKVE